MTKLKELLGQFFPYVFIALISFLFVADAFMVNAHMASFDHGFHLSMIAQFVSALSSGEFPVRWANGTANYGSALPLLAHQLTSYLGAIMYYLTGGLLQSLFWLYYIGAFGASVFLYKLLRKYTVTTVAITAVVVYHFSCYRILNMYVRGAMPEFFMALFVPFIMYSLYLYGVEGKTRLGKILLLSGGAGLALGHPMMLIIFMPLYVLYGLFLHVHHKVSIRKILIAFLAMGIGIGTAAYYLIPLLIEIKYMYYGSGPGHLSQHYFMGLENYFKIRWSYFSSDGVFTRPHTLQFGLIEAVFLSVNAVFAFYLIIRRKKNWYRSPFVWLSAASFYYVFMTTSASLPVYKLIQILQSIQFPWRMWGALGFIAAFCVAAVLHPLRQRIQSLFAVLIICIVALMQFPQLYGKNYSVKPDSAFFYSKFNPHSVLMQPIWAGESESYPVRQKQAEIISGTGNIEIIKLKNSYRLYTIKGKGEVRLIDNTFYFPGWKVYVDGVNTDIQFQDPAYRGIITYIVPGGTHSVKVVFENTRIRFIANAVTLFFIALCAVYLFLSERFEKGKKSRTPSRKKK